MVGFPHIGSRPQTNLMLILVHVILSKGWKNPKGLDPCKELERQFKRKIENKGEGVQWSKIEIDESI